MYDFDSELIDSCAQKLTEENVCVCYSWKDNKPDTTETWFKTKYSTEQISPEMRQAWKNAKGLYAKSTFNSGLFKVNFFPRKAKAQKVKDTYFTV